MSYVVILLTSSGMGMCALARTFGFECVSAFVSAKLLHPAAPEKCFLLTNFQLIFSTVEWSRPQQSTVSPAQGDAELRAWLQTDSGLHGGESG